ncbi:MAG TPA: UDP-N-acetylmuramoyl-tripeptide--D-alanyl-D-alanine ligase, partial [Vicinamibacterales bacterium]|nr:UDP-N-acetylmuramoyl-tripeptide--D-alanyl-D-alanine ligase [Vicinamibacterales bacterium]
MTPIVSAVVLTAGMVVTATGGRLVNGEPAREFRGVSTDSRAIVPGSLFVALRGDRFDGHEFAAAAIAAGAAGVIASAPVSAPADVAVISVPDTLEALQRLGHDIRRRSGARVVAITGSAGKTTTKEVTAELLATRYVVFRNRGNLNNHIGLPLSLTELAQGQQVAVVELGMNHPGEIRTLVGIADPDVRVWTNVGDAHIGFFGSREAIARAKAEILERATPATVVVANADDALVMSHVAKFTGRRVTFGESRSADVRASHVVDRGFDGTSAAIATPAGAAELTVPLAGRAQLSNVLAATAVALEFQIPLQDVVARVKTLAPVARRGAVTTLSSGVRLVDDSYNASPAAMAVMLAALAATPASGRRIAVLGEMLELGDQAIALHDASGRAAARAGVNELVVIGGSPADGLVAGAT